MWTDRTLFCGLTSARVVNPQPPRTCARFRLFVANFHFSNLFADGARFGLLERACELSHALCQNASSFTCGGCPGLRGHTNCSGRFFSHPLLCLPAPPPRRARRRAAWWRRGARRAVFESFFFVSCRAVLASRPSSNPAGSAHGVAHTVLRGLRAVTPLTARPGEFSPVNKFSSAFAAHARAQLASPCLK